MDENLRSLPVGRRVALLVKALDGAKRTNEALAECGDGEAMLDVLLNASAKLGLGLSREDLQNTPPIRDWVWWKNKEALLTIGDNRPRYQQDQAAGGRAAETTSSSETGSSAETGTAPRRRFLGLF